MADPDDVLLAYDDFYVPGAPPAPQPPATYASVARGGDSDYYREAIAGTLGGGPLAPAHERAEGLTDDQDYTAALEAFIAARRSYDDAGPVSADGGGWEVYACDWEEGESAGEGLARHTENEGPVGGAPGDSDDEDAPLGAFIERAEEGLVSHTEEEGPVGGAPPEAGREATGIAAYVTSCGRAE